MSPPEEEIERAARVLESGGLVAFPTETVYGLGADASCAPALRRLYSVKGRPPSHPVIVHIADGGKLDDWAVDVPAAARELAAQCWPGPLTLVLRRHPHVLDEVTGGQDTVGIRVPAQPTALALLERFGRGVAAPSANRFGRVSPTTAAHVRAELGPDVDVILDDGPSRVGVESTVVDWSSGDPVVLRPGGVPRERLEAVIGVPVPVAVSATTRAPGTLPSHYAPRARVELVDDASLSARAHDRVAAGTKVGVIASKLPDHLPDGVRVLAVPADAQEYAFVLFTSLRDADRAGLDVVLAVPPPEADIGAAVVDRLRRAAAARP